MARKSEVILWSGERPFSADPLDYDAFIHHVAFRSVYASVVSQYKVGEIVPILISKWSASSDFTTWHLKVRPGMTFSNGDKITADAIGKNWRRVAFLMQKAESQSGLFEFLKGIEHLTSPSQDIFGLQVGGDEIILQFKRPVKDFLERISFGIYGIAHPDNFDSQSGKWKDPKQIISSGPYIIGNWSEREIVLNLRADATKLFELPAKPILKIRITNNLEEDADIYIGGNDTGLVDEKFDYFGPVTSYIRYASCIAWRDQGSPCHERTFRKIMRNHFYEALVGLGYKPTYSFFPLTMSGIFENAVPTVDRNAEAGSKQSKLRVGIPTIPKVQKLKFSFAKLFSAAADKLGESLRMKIEKIPSTKLNGRFFNDPKHALNFDLIFLTTGILVENPQHDIQFMFLSKHGIHLPDETGKIVEALRADRVDPQEINMELWDQAIIWPIGHFSLGMFVRKGLFDLSLLNPSLPPSDFQWISLAE